MPKSYKCLLWLSEIALHLKWWMNSQNLFFLCTNLRAASVWPPPTHTWWQSKHGSNYKHYQNSFAVMSSPHHPQWSHLTDRNAFNLSLASMVPVEFSAHAARNLHTKKQVCKNALTHTQICLMVPLLLFVNRQMKTHPYANNWKACLQAIPLFWSSANTEQRNLCQ